MAKVLILGAGGFVGTEIIRQAKEKGDEICAFYHSHIADSTVDNVRADLVDAGSVKTALKGCTFDIIYHAASLPGDTGNPKEMMEVNVTGLFNMLEWARANPVKRYVLTSSISAYEWYPMTKFNPPDYMPVDENHPCRPKDMYATTKRMQELLALTYYHQYKVPAAVLRLTAVVGPGGKGGGRSWRTFAEMLKEGKKVQIPHFSPEELCHYVDIRDVGRMHLVVGENPKAVGEIFNCCAKEPTRGSEFIEIIKKIKSDIEVECGFAWSMAQGGEIQFDMNKAKQLLDFEPQYSLADSIHSIMDWIDAGGLETEKTTERKYKAGRNKE
ncbi:MAG: NAD(P)-dependent oxidoreductase [Spirochaetota bacterium]